MPKNKISQFLKLDTLDPKVRHIIGMPIAFAFTSFLALVATIPNYLSTPTWQLLTVVLSNLFVLGANLVCYVLIRRGRVRLGAWILLATTWWNLGFTGVLYQGLGLILSISAIFLTVLISVLAFSGRDRIWSIIGGSLVGYFIFGIDNVTVFSMSWRTTSVSTQSAYAIMIGMLVAAVVVIAFQFRNFSLTGKLITSFLGLTIFVAVLLAVITDNVSQARLRSSIGSQLQFNAASQGKIIGDDLLKQVNLLETLTQAGPMSPAVSNANASYTGSEADIQARFKQLDAEWISAADENEPLVHDRLTQLISEDLRRFRDQFPNHVEVFVTDRYGGIVGTTNRTSDYYQADEEWWQKAYNNGAGAVYIGSPEYDDSTQTYAVNMAVPVRDQNNALIGVLRTTYNVRAIASIITTSKIGETGKFDLLIPTGPSSFIVFNQSGIAPASLDVLDIINSLNGKTSIQHSYENQVDLLSQAPVRTVDNAADISNLNWVVLAQQSSDEALSSIQSLLRLITLVVYLLVGVTALMGYGVSLLLSRPILQLTQVAEKVSAGDLTARAKVESRDEIGSLANAFNNMTGQLNEMVGTLEQRVAARTQELSLAADVGRTVSQLRDLDALLPRAVELIRAQFSLYYAQIYLTDASVTMLTLRAGTGGVGAELLRRGHRLPVGPGSINGQAAADRKPKLVTDTASSPLFRPNPLLPETRSEMAVPLMVGERVVGVMDLQSRHPGELSNENLQVFETLAGQLAIALENAALFAQTEQARQEVEEQSRRLTQAGWQEYLNALERGERIGYLYDQENLSSYNTPLPETPAENTVKSPILVTGSPVGTIQLERAGDQPWQPEEVALVNAVVSQAARQLDNLRLLAQAESYRNEAEEAARRLTREGWADYLETKTEINSFVYDQVEVKPLPVAPLEGQSDQPADVVLQPLKVGNETVGELAFDGVASLDAATTDLVTNVAGLLGSHIESLRLTEQTQKALIDTEDLYTAGSELNIARTYTDILDVMRSHSLVGDRTHVALINLFNRPGSENDMPEFIEPAAVWNDSPLEGTMGRSSMAVFPSALATLHPNYPTLIEDVLNDNRLDEAARVLYFEQLKARSLLLIPLVAGGQWIGYITAGYMQFREFSPEAVRRTMALAGQAAVAINNLRLLAETQALAQRETNLRQITALVRGSTNADTILRNATRELGMVLGRKVKVQLSGNPAAEKPTSGGAENGRRGNGGSAITSQS